MSLETLSKRIAKKQKTVDSLKKKLKEAEASLSSLIDEKEALELKELMKVLKEKGLSVSEVKEQIEKSESSQNHIN